MYKKKLRIKNTYSDFNSAAVFLSDDESNEKCEVYRLEQVHQKYKYVEINQFMSLTAGHMEPLFTHFSPSVHLYGGSASSSAISNQRSLSGTAQTLLDRL